MSSWASMETRATWTEREESALALSYAEGPYIGRMDELLGLRNHGRRVPLLLGHCPSEIGGQQGRDTEKPQSVVSGEVFTCDLSIGILHA